MRLLTKFAQEKCPICNETLTADKSNSLLSHILKSCPNEHYEKEFIPALEGYIEHYKTPTK
nr:hypothetical protein [Paenibacillus lignilyticus]